MARSLRLGLAVAFGATLLAPAAPALAGGTVHSAGSVHAAGAGPSCVTEELTQSELNDLMDEVNAATSAKAAHGFRYVVNSSDDAVTQGLIVTRDAEHRRLEANMTIGPESLRLRSLANGYQYLLVSVYNEFDAPGLRVLHRPNAWVNIGRTKQSDDINDVIQFEDVSVGGTCEQDGSRLTITFTEDDGQTTITTDSSGAVTAVNVMADETNGAMATLTYGSHTVADIPVHDRVSSAAWSHALASADKRTDMITWAEKVGKNAKALAKKAHRPLMAKDVQAAAKSSPLKSSKRTTIKSGVSVAAKAKDPYNHKTMRISVRSIDHVISIGTSW